MCDKVIRLYNVWRLLGTIIRIRLLEIRRWPLKNLLWYGGSYFVRFSLFVEERVQGFPPNVFIFSLRAWKGYRLFETIICLFEITSKCRPLKVLRCGFQSAFVFFLHPSWLGKPKLGWNYSKDLLIIPIITIVLSIINYPSFSRIRGIGSQLHHLGMKAEIKCFNLCGYFFNRRKGRVESVTK